MPNNERVVFRRIKRGVVSSIMSYCRRQISLLLEPVDGLVVRCSRRVFQNESIENKALSGGRPLYGISVENDPVYQGQETYVGYHQV